MSVAEAAPMGHKPAPVAPTHEEVLSRSRRLVDRAVILLDEEALRIERDRMAGATAHSVRKADGRHKEYAKAWEAARDALATVVTLKAAKRTHGFTVRTQS